MTPTLASNNTTNGTLFNVKALGNLILVHALSFKFSNLADFILRQLSHGMFLAKVASSLGCHIRHILSMRAKEQVIGVYARWVVTSMEDALSFGKDFIVGYFPHEMMGEYNSMAIPDAAITFLISTAGPEPTFGIHREYDTRTGNIMQWQ